MNFLVTEYIKGNLRDDNNSIDEYVNTLRTMMKDNADDEKEPESKLIIKKVSRKNKIQEKKKKL